MSAVAPLSRFQRAIPRAEALFLIDASIFVFRAWHSVPNTLVDHDGNPVNALHGFARFLGDLIEQVRPQHIAVAFDERLATSFRSQLYPAVQGESRTGAVELKRQFALCRQLCRRAGSGELRQRRVRSRRHHWHAGNTRARAGKNVVIVTRDKDLSQLVRRGDEYWDYLDDRRYRL